MSHIEFFKLAGDCPIPPYSIVLQYYLTYLTYLSQNRRGCGNAEGKVLRLSSSAVPGRHVGKPARAPAGCRVPSGAGHAQLVAALGPAWNSPWSWSDDHTAPQTSLIAVSN